MYAKGVIFSDKIITWLCSSPQLWLTFFSQSCFQEEIFKITLYNTWTEPVIALRSLKEKQS